MNTWARIISELKIANATTLWRACASVPAMLLFWFQLRRLATALDSLFTAWKAGALPPPASAPVPSSAIPAPTPRVRAAHPKSTPRSRKPGKVASRRERPALRAIAPVPPPQTLPLLLCAPVLARCTFPRLRKRRRRKTG